MVKTVRKYEINTGRFSNGDDGDRCRALAELFEAVIGSHDIPSYVALCEYVRSLIGSKNTLLLTLTKEGDAAVIEFDHENDGETYAHHFDFDEKKYYIEVFEDDKVDSEEVSQEAVR